MSERRPAGLLDEESPRPGESFLARLHRRKTEAREHLPAVAEAAPGAGEPEAQETVGAPPPPALTDADMPPLESLTIDSDFTGFLSEKVSESLRRAALRRLFHSSEFNIVDGLDEYAEDFTRFEALGDIVTADMRHQIEVAARKQAEAAKQALLDGTADEPESAMSTQAEPEQAAEDDADAGERKDGEPRTPTADETQ
jgi:hypothetical protein